MIADKKNGNVCFNDASHTYWDESDNTKKYISVTTLIEKYAQPFDKNFWSAYKALEKLIPKDDWKVVKSHLLSTKKINKSELFSTYDITEDMFNKEQQGILDEWEKTNKESCERGTKIHLEMENSFYGNKRDTTLKKFGVGGKFECKKNYCELDLPCGVYPEYLIYRTSDDGILNIAGQIDVLIKNGNNIIIGDWKTNKEIKQKGGFDTTTKQTAKMKYPLNNLDDCNFYHYTLQLSTYAWMIQKLHPEFEIQDLILCHYDHAGRETIYHLDYLKHEVELMLAHYKKELIKQKQRAKFKRIEY